MTTDGITKANINSSKYLFIIDNGSRVDDGCCGDLAKFWILNPKMNDDVPIRKDTMVRIFCVMLGIRVSGTLVCCCCCCCCASANTGEMDKLLIIKNCNSEIARINFSSRLYLANDDHCLYDNSKWTARKDNDGHQ